MQVDVDMCGKQHQGCCQKNWNMQASPTWWPRPLLHDILLFPEICQNIIYVFVLLRLGFDWHFHEVEARLFLETTYLGSGFVRDGLIVMNVDVFP